MSQRDDAIGVLEAQLLEGEGPPQEWVPIDSVHPWAENPRKIPEQAVRKVAELMKKFGWTNAMLVRAENGEVIAGHTRLQAAKLLGFKRVLVKRFDISEDDAHILAMGDNRSGEEADWDEQLLAKHFRELSAKDLRATGFDTFEIADAMKVSESLSMGSPRIDRVEDSEAFRFRAFKMQIAVDTGERLNQAIEAYADRVGTTNGFVEHLLDAIDQEVAKLTPPAEPPTAE